MATIIKETPPRTGPIDMSAFEAQLGGGGGGNGEKNNGDGDARKDEPENNNLWVGLGALGSIGGLVVGNVATVYADTYIDNQAVVEVPSSSPAVEQGYHEGITRLEVGTYFGPIVLLAAVGAIIGKAIERHWGS